MNKNEIIETLLEDFLESRHTGELSDELHRLSAEIDAQIKAGNVDDMTVADYELAATRYGFYAGFLAAQKCFTGTAG
ncbi:MAG: hypothetical protein IJT76_02560 [Clostridia bacterium]|nr:hypothetical protein [Clostridia bacterium]